MAEPMPYDRRDEDSGKFTPETPDSAFLDAIREQGELTTAEVADAVDKQYRSVYDRLKSLEADGRVSSYKRGSMLFWTVEDDDG